MTNTGRRLRRGRTVLPVCGDPFPYSDLNPYLLYPETSLPIPYHTPSLRPVPDDRRTRPDVLYPTSFTNSSLFLCPEKD